MKQLQEDIRNKQFQKVYLLYGEETYLLRQYKTMLMNAVAPDNDPMNTTVYTGKGIDPAVMIDLGETVPFFAERRVILVEDSGFFKNKVELLPEYLAELPDYLCLIFIEREVDKRSRMYKAVSKYGRAVEFKKQDSRTLMTWILQRLKKEGKHIRRENMELFLERTGTDMNRIAAELEKLICYLGQEDVVTREAIETIVSENIENKIFDMIQAVTERRQQDALNMYYDLLSMKEPPMRILYLITRQFNILMQIRELSDIGKNQKDIASMIGLQPWVVQKSMQAARRYSLSVLRGAVEEMVATETAVKTGKMKDTLSVEVLIVKYSQAAR